MRIPLPRMLRSWRKRQFEQDKTSFVSRAALKAWAALARRPWLYRLAVAAPVAVLAALGRDNGRFRWLPFGRGWTTLRDLPAPEGGTFISRWHKAQSHKERRP